MPHARFHESALAAPQGSNSGHAIVCKWGMYRQRRNTHLSSSSTSAGVPTGSDLLARLNQPLLSAGLPCCRCCCCCSSAARRLMMAVLSASASSSSRTRGTLRCSDHFSSAFVIGLTSIVRYGNCKHHALLFAFVAVHQATGTEACRAPGTSLAQQSTQCFKSAGQIPH